MNGKIKNRKILKVATKMILEAEKIKNDKNISKRKEAAERLIATKYYYENGAPKIEKGFFGKKKVKFENMQYPSELYLLNKIRSVERVLEYIESQPHSYETLMNIVKVNDLLHRTKIFFKNGHNDEELSERADEFVEFVRKHIVTRHGVKTFRIAGREDVRKRELRPDGKMKTRRDYLEENLKYYHDYKAFLNEKAAEAKEEKEK